MPQLGLPKLSHDPVLFLPLWLGTLRDRSGYGNHLSLVNTPHWSSANGVDAARDTPTDYFVAAHSASLSVASLSFIFWGTNLRQRPGYVFFRKTGAGTRYQFYAINATTLNLYNGTTSSTIALSMAGARFFAVTLVNGTKPRFFTEGIFRGLGSVAQTISPTTSVLEIAAAAGSYAGVMMYPGALDDAEILQLYDYSQFRITPRKQWPGGGLRYPDRGDPYVPATGDPMYIDNIQSARVTLANQTSGKLSNTPYQIESGTISLDENASGRHAIPSAATHLSRRNLEAYGTWEFDYTLATDATMQLGIIGTQRTVVSVGNNGYSLYYHGGTEIIRLAKLVNGSVSAWIDTGPVIQAGVRYSFRITRTTVGLFTVYMRGGVYANWMQVLTGTDNIYTTSLYASSFIPVGHMLHADRQFAGVLAP